jgi:hypothetical protein
VRAISRAGREVTVWGELPSPMGGVLASKLGKQGYTSVPEVSSGLVDGPLFSSAVSVVSSTFGFFDPRAPTPPMAVASSIEGLVRSGWTDMRAKLLLGPFISSVVKRRWATCSCRIDGLAEEEKGDVRSWN